MSSVAALRLPRIVHPIAWWIWAIGLATAATRTTNPLLLALVLGVVGTVVAARRTEAPWARAFSLVSASSRMCSACTAAPGCPESGYRGTADA